MRKARYFVPAAAFYLLIFILSSLDYDLDIPVRGVDKLAHFIEFSFLGFLLSLGFFKTFTFSAPLKSVLVFITGLPLGALDELHQLFVPGRTSALNDVLADAAGIIAGILVYYLYVAKRKKPPSGGRAN